MSGATAAKRGRPARAGVALTPAELAALADVPEARIVKACEAGILPHARQVDGVWRIPAVDVSRVVFRSAGVQQLYSYKSFAALLGVCYHTVLAATKKRLGEREPRLRTVDALGEPRIPESEFWRVTGLQPPRR